MADTCIYFFKWYNIPTALVWSTSTRRYLEAINSVIIKIKRDENIVELVVISNQNDLLFKSTVGN